MTPEAIRNHVYDLQRAKQFAPEGAVLGFAQLNSTVNENYGPVLICTCGMTEMGMPEILITGNNEANLSMVIAHITTLVCEGHIKLEDGMILNEQAAVRLRVHKLTQHQARVPGTICNEYYRVMNKWPEYFQLAIADPQNNLPDEPGYNAQYMYNYGQREYWKV